MCGLEMISEVLEPHSYGTGMKQGVSSSGIGTTQARHSACYESFLAGVTLLLEGARISARDRTN